jgi:hypothetical protein
LLIIDLEKDYLLAPVKQKKMLTQIKNLSQIINKITMKTLFSSIVLLLLTSLCFAQTGGGTSTSIPGTSSCISSFPYLNNFEVGIEWNQSSGDDFDWSRLSGSTPASGTTGSTMILTINDSFPDPQSGATGSSSPATTITHNDSFPDPQSGATGSSGPATTITHNDSFPDPQSAILTSPCFNISQLGSAQLSFLYRVQGTGQILELEASTDGTNWALLWSSTGSTGNTWNTAVVALKRYKLAQSLQFRLKGTIYPNTASGTAWQGEMSVDDILLSSGNAGRRNALGTTDGLQVKAFPNPFQDQLSVAIPYVENQTATVGLYHVSGKQVFVQSEIASGTSVRIQSDIAPGLYVVRVQMGNEQYQVKVIKTE